MRRFLLLTASLTAGLALAHDDHHDRKPDDPFTLKPLRGGVHALYGRGGNVGIFVGPDAVLVVDSQFKELAPGILAKARTLSDKPVKYLLNTHHHGDHVGGNGAFRPISVIVAHDNVRKRMLSAPKDVLAQFPALLDEAKKKGDAESVAYLEEQIAWAKKVKVEEIPAPVLTFDSEMRFHVEGSGETIHLWHVPASHTDGDGVVYFEKANVLHMGDVFFNEVIPYIDVTAGGSPAGYLVAVDKVLARVPADVVVIPGHGEVSDVAGLKKMRRYVADIIAAAKKAKSEGKTKDAFLAAVEMPQYKDWDGYPDRFRKNCAAAWDELK